MPKAFVYPYIAAHVNNVEDFVVGENRVKGFRIGQGQPGYLLLVVELEECDDCPDAPKERRFMVHPANVTFECGEPTEVEVQGRPELVVPDTKVRIQ